MEKTIFEWLYEWLTEEELKQALNTIPAFDTASSFASALSNAFVWAQTKEGHSYWDSISLRENPKGIDVKETRGRPIGAVTIEGIALSTGKPGLTFYTVKSDRLITSLASHYGKKVTTERMIVTTTGGKIPISSYITKVTIL